MENKLIIIDGNSVLYREFFALPNLRNSSGEPTGAIYGFARHIIEIVTKIKPSHLVVAFDAGKHTFRNDMFDGYKANRKPMPDDLRAQLSPLKNMLDEMHIKHIEVKGIEGDDVIGSLANKFDVPTIIVTGDRDSFQLVNDRVVVYLNKKGLSDVKIMDKKAIMDNFGLLPAQMAEVKALQGDSSDNIPGVKGVGEKTALGLIQKFKNVDGVYANLDLISANVRQKLESDREMAYKSLELAKIKIDAEIDVKLEDLLVEFPFNEDVKKIFNYHGFKSLANKLELFKLDGFEQNVVEEFKSSVIKEIKIKELSAKETSEELKDKTEIAVYFNGSNLVLTEGKNCYKVIINDGDEFCLKNIFENEKIRKVVFDGKKIRHYLSRFNILLCGDVFDVMIAKHLVSGKSVIKLEDIIDGDVVSEETIVASLIGLKEELIDNLNRMNMAELFYKIEMPLSSVLFDMEKAGFKLDLERLKEQEVKYEKELSELTKAIYEVVGHEFNINSPKQLGEIVYDELKLARSTKKSTASEKLEKLIDKHPLIPMVIRYRKITKCANIDKNDYWTRRAEANHSDSWFC